MSEPRRLFGLSVAMILGLFLGVSQAQHPASDAEALMVCLPEDTVLCLAGSSLQSIKPHIDKGVLGAAWRDQGVQSFVKEILAGMTPILQKALPHANPATVPMAIRGAKTLIKCPRLFAVAPSHVPESVGIYGLLVIDAGQHKADMLALIEPLEDMIGTDEFETHTLGAVTVKAFKDKDDLPLYWAWVGDRFVLAINDPGHLAIRAIQKEAWHAKDRFSRVPGRGDLMLAYADYPACLAALTGALEYHEDEEAALMVKKIWQTLGFSGLKEKVARIGMTDSGLVADALVTLSGPREGLMSLARPVSRDQFRGVNASAMEALAFNWDLPGAYDLAFKVLKQACDPEEYAEVQQALKDFESQLGLSIRQDLLEPVTGPVVGYTIPPATIPEAAMGGSVAVLQVSDTKAFLTSLQKIGKLAQSMGEGKLQISTQTVQERTYHCCVIPMMALAQVIPTWTRVDDHVIFATSVPLCQYAADQMEMGGNNSLYTQEALVNLNQSGPSKNLLSLTYTDSRAKMHTSYSGLQQVWPMATMAAARTEVSLPFILPPIAHLIKDLKPTCGYVWEDAAGIHSHLEGGTVELGALAGASLGAGIMMPALARARQLAYRTQSATVLSGMGKACLIYANDNDDKLPPDLETLIELGYIDAKFLKSSRRKKGASGPDYLYISGQTVMQPLTNIVAYENPETCKDPKKINVLFLDSHVALISMEELEDRLTETYQTLGRKRPEPRPQPVVEPSNGKEHNE